MDKYSFLNAIHPEQISELYATYLKTPDVVEPSWRAFFQGFDFGIESGSVTEGLGITGADSVPQNVLNEFKVIKLIDGYRTRGHLFTKTNPVRERRKYQPTLALENFGLQQSDLQTEFEAGSIIGLGKTTLAVIVSHLEAIYCNSIGVEYMYIRNPEEIKWIQNWINTNDNSPAVFFRATKTYIKEIKSSTFF